MVANVLLCTVPVKDLCILCDNINVNEPDQLGGLISGSAKFCLPDRPIRFTQAAKSKRGREKNCTKKGRGSITD
jgi:hypothetical protein